MISRRLGKDRDLLNYSMNTRQDQRIMLVLSPSLLLLPLSHTILSLSRGYPERRMRILINVSIVSAAITRNEWREIRRYVRIDSYTVNTTVYSSRVYIIYIYNI